MNLIKKILKSLTNRKVDLFFLLILLALNLKLALHISPYYDIDVYDSSAYLHNSLNFDSISADWGPLYSLYLRILLFLFGSIPAQTYYFNISFISTLLPLLIYLCCRTNNPSPFISFILSSLVSLSIVNYPVDNKVDLFCVSLILLIYLFTCWKGKNKFFNSSNLFILSLGSLFLTYVRPQYFLTFIFTLILLFISVFIGNYNMKFVRKFRLNAVKLITPIILAILLWNYVGKPISGSRLGCYFYLHYYQYHHQDYPGENFLNEDDFYKKKFPHVESFHDFIVKEPNLFVGHILFSTKNFVYKLKDIYLKGMNFFFRPYSMKEGLFIWTLLIGLILFNFKHSTFNIVSLKFNLLFFLLMASPSFLPSMIISSFHYRYLTATYMLSFLVISTLTCFTFKKNLQLLQYPLAIFLLWLSPNPSTDNVSFGHNFSKNNPRPYQKLFSNLSIKYNTSNKQLNFFVNRVDTCGYIGLYIPWAKEHYDEQIYMTPPEYDPNNSFKNFQELNLIQLRSFIAKNEIELIVSCRNEHKINDYLKLMTDLGFEKMNDIQFPIPTYSAVSVWTKKTPLRIL